MKAVPQIINNECGDGDCGAGGVGGGGVGGHELVEFGGQGDRASGRHKVERIFFFKCVSLECGLWGGSGRGGSEWESGSPGKDPSGPHLAAT